MKQNKIHLSFLTETFFPKHKAGTEIYVLNLAKNLIKKGFKISIIIPTKNNKISDYIYENISVYTFPVVEKITAAELNGLTKISGLQEFTEILKKIKPDILHVHSFSRSVKFFHLKAAKQLNIKTVFTPHLGGNFCVKGDFLYMSKNICKGKIDKNKCLACFIFEKNYNELICHVMARAVNFITLSDKIKNKYPALNIVKYRKLNINSLNKYADKVVAISPWIKKVFNINNISDIEIINQGIDTKMFDNKENKNISNRKIIISFVGRTNYTKGIHILLKALLKIKIKNNLYVNLILTAINENKKYYGKIISMSGKLSNIKIYKTLPQKELNSILNSTDILCLPSISGEMSPLVILEAFAKGIPVIGSDYPAISDLVEHNFNGLLFKNKSVEDLQKQLERLISEPDLIKNLSNNVNLPRSTDDVANEHYNLYKTII